MSGLLLFTCRLPASRKASTHKSYWAPMPLVSGRCHICIGQMYLRTGQMPPHARCMVRCTFPTRGDTGAPPGLRPDSGKSLSPRPWDYGMADLQVVAKKTSILSLRSIIGSLDSIAVAYSSPKTTAAVASLVSASPLPASSLKVTRTLMTLPSSDAWRV